MDLIELKGEEQSLKGVFLMFYIFSKRILDVLVSLLVLLLLSPLFLIIIFLLKISGEGEILYLQERIGFRNSKFKIWKFATMLKDSMNLGTGSITLQNDFRVTKIGIFLRKTKKEKDIV